jgi:hypothetical protein
MRGRICGYWRLSFSIAESWKVNRTKNTCSDLIKSSLAHPCLGPI